MCRSSIEPFVKSTPFCLKQTGSATWILEALLCSGFRQFATPKRRQLIVWNGCVGGSRFRLPLRGAVLRLLRLPLSGAAVSRIPAFPSWRSGAMLKAPMLFVVFVEICPARCAKVRGNRRRVLRRPEVINIVTDLELNGKG